MVAINENNENILNPGSTHWFLKIGVYQKAAVTLCLLMYILFKQLSPLALALTDDLA